MSEEWENPPPKLVRGKRKFSVRFILGLVAALYFGGVLFTWAVTGRWVPIDFTMIFWAFPMVFVLIVLLLVWWVTG